MIGRYKKASFQDLKDKMKSKVDSWSMKLLSQEGKEVFIKSILQTILIYDMACFLLSNSLCIDFERIIANFWWQKGKRQRRIHWCEWDKLYDSKENSGLGFRNLSLFNIFLLAK